MPSFAFISQESLSVSKMKNENEKFLQAKHFFVFTKILLPLLSLVTFTKAYSTIIF